MDIQNLPDYIAQEFAGSDVDPSRGDIVDVPLYYQTTIAASTSVDENNFKFFDSPAGKTLRQTNLKSANMLPAGEAFSIRGIGVYFPPDIDRADALNILKNFALVLKINSTEKFVSPIYRLCAGGGLVATDDVASRTYLSNGLQSPVHKHVLSVPIVIPGQTSFEVFGKGTAFSSAAQITADVVFSGLWLKNA